MIFCLQSLPIPAMLAPLSSLGAWNSHVCSSLPLCSVSNNKTSVLKQDFFHHTNSSPFCLVCFTHSILLQQELNDSIKSWFSNLCMVCLDQPMLLQADMNTCSPIFVWCVWVNQASYLTNTPMKARMQPQGPLPQEANFKPSPCMFEARQ